MNNTQAAVLKEWVERAHAQLAAANSTRPVEQLTDVAFREVAWSRQETTESPGPHDDRTAAIGSLLIDMQSKGGRLADEPAEPLGEIADGDFNGHLVAEHVIGGVRGAAFSNGKDVMWRLDVTYRYLRRDVAEGRARDFVAAAARATVRAELAQS